MLGTVSTQNQVVSTINIQSLLTATSIIGDGSQIYNLPAISSLSLQSTITGLGTFGYISTSQLTSTITGWANFPAIANLNMNNYEIINLNQTTTVNSAATNLVVSQSYSNIIDLTSFNEISLTQLLTSFPTTLTYKNPNVFTDVWQVSFSFSGELNSTDDEFAYYFSLSNQTQTFETIGQNFNSSTIRYVSPGFRNNKYLSDSYTDAYNLSTWANDDTYCVLLYFQGKTLSANNFKDITAPCVYNSFMQPTLSYE